MDEKDKIIVEFITEVWKLSTDDYMRIKLILMASSADDPALMKFLKKAFGLADSYRPRLIGMKGGTV